MTTSARSGHGAASGDNGTDPRPALESSARPRIESVDGLRAFAFTLVFLFHTWEFSGKPRIPVVTDVISQNTRPDLFIVLTGFALFLPFALDETRSLRFRTGPYLVRRLRRIVLPYYAALALAFLIPVILKLLFQALGRETNPIVWPSMGDVASHLTFSHMFFPDYWDGINGSLWTMSLEMQLYLLFPLVVLAVARWGLTALIPIALIGLGYRVAVGAFVDGPGFPDLFLWGATGLGRLMEFVAGMFASVVALRWRERLPRLSWIPLVGLVACGYLLAVGPMADTRWFPVRESALAVSFAALVILAITVSPVERLFAARPVARLGFVAYSMFLVHQPVTYYLAELLHRLLGLQRGPVFLAIMWTVGLALVLVIGGLLFRFVEAPCLRWAKRTPSATTPGPLQTSPHRLEIAK